MLFSFSTGDVFANYSGVRDRFPHEIWRNYSLHRHLIIISPLLSIPQPVLILPKLPRKLSLMRLLKLGPLPARRGVSQDRVSYGIVQFHRGHPLRYIKTYSPVWVRTVQRLCRAKSHRRSVWLLKAGYTVEKIGGKRREPVVFHFAECEKHPPVRFFIITHADFVLKLGKS